MTFDCCSAAEGGERGIDHCARCGKKGMPVSLATVRAMVRADVDAVKLSAQVYRLCRNLICPAVYFVPGITIDKTELRVPVNFKEKNYEGPVCYCFDHTVESIRAEIQSSGRSTAFDMITNEVRAGRCACEVKNPAGTCCLGDILKVVKSLTVQLLDGSQRP